MPIHTSIYTEMGMATDAKIQWSGGPFTHYRLRTHLELKGRGIKQIGDGTDSLTGTKTYTATELAFKKLKTKYSTCALLDL